MFAQPQLELLKRYTGRSMKRVEDGRLLTANTRFVDDLDIPGMLYAAVLRSPYAHARIIHIDLTRAIQMPGVIAAISGDDAQHHSKPLPAYGVRAFKPEEYFMATSKCRYVGEPVAAVAAVDPALAEDALEAIEVDYEPIPAVVNEEEAMKPEAPLVYDSFGTNVVAHYQANWGDVDKAFREADITVKERLTLHRFSSTPLEPVAAIADYNQGTGDLTLWCNAQMSGHVMMVLSDLLNIPTHKLHLIIQDIGGGFGIKTRPWKQLLIPTVLSMKAGRPVKYVETRTEHLMASGQTAGATFYVEAAAKKDGRVIGLRLRDINNDGASLTYAGTYASMHATLICGAYKIRNIAWDSYVVLTNTCPSMPNRGVGKPGIVYLIERMMDLVSQRLDIDPVELRERNFIQPNELPYLIPSGRVYDSGNYPAMLQRLLELARYTKLRQQQKELRKQGRYIGIGISTYVHGSSATASEIEGMTVKVDPRGKVIAASGSPDMGTSHATAITQIVSDELGVTPEDVVVLPFDSDISPWTPYSGTHANKFSGPDIEALVSAVKILRERIVRVAAKLLGAKPEDVILYNSRAHSKNDPNNSKHLSEIARETYQNPGLLPLGVEPGLQVTYIGNTPRALESFVSGPQYETGALHQLVTGHGSPTGFMTTPSSAHIAMVEVDPETGQLHILKYFIVTDNGRLINPIIAQGQHQGNAAFGIGTALFEEFIYNAEGQLLTATFADYCKPTTCEIPNIVDDHIETPSPRSSLGIKGIGEGEALGPLPTIINAVEDALSPLGVRIQGGPLTQERLYNLVREACEKEKRVAASQ